MGWLISHSNNYCGESKGCCKAYIKGELCGRGKSIGE